MWSSLSELSRIAANAGESLIKDAGLDNVVVSGKSDACDLDTVIPISFAMQNQAREQLEGQISNLASTVLTIEPGERPGVQQQVGHHPRLIRHVCAPMRSCPC